MHSSLLLISVLLPVVAGFLYLFLGKGPRVLRRAYVLVTVLATSVLTLLLFLFPPEKSLDLIAFTRELELHFHLDGLGRFFSLILAVLYPLTSLYALSYMERWRHNRPFFMFFLISYGVSLGICFAGNILTLYCFYELLTLSTMPLVMNEMDQDSIRAARTYLIYSIGGAAFAFIGVVYLLSNGISHFEFGNGLFAEDNMARIMYIVTFIGFGAKAAIFPMHTWLPRAAVAPTPVTALLHAVAVVKAGAFAIIRLTHYSFQSQSLIGTWPQYVVLILCAVTIVYGSAMAMRQIHFKRRLAYSTVANMSYILLGVALMTPAGLQAGLMHMIIHAITKILAFFCAGAVLHMTHKEYVRDLSGMGYRMPVTFACFAVASLSLAGIPPFSGFVSKWHLLTASAQLANPAAYIGAAALLISALFTVIYMFSVCVRAYFPVDGTIPTDRTEADWRMTVPMVILAILVIACGLFAQPIAQWTLAIACGL